MINKLPVSVSLKILTWDEVPIPTDNLGLTNKSIESLFSKSCDEDVVTVVFTLLTVVLTWLKSVSNEYRSLSALLIFLKYTSLKLFPIPVFIPTVLIVLFTIYKESPVERLNVGESLSVDIAITGDPPGIVNITFSFVLNGWFSRYICFVGTFLVTLLPAKENDNVLSSPSSVPKPTVWSGLKNTFLLTIESKKDIFLLNVNESGK